MHNRTKHTSEIKGMQIFFAEREQEKRREANKRIIIFVAVNLSSAEIIVAAFFETIREFKFRFYCGWKLRETYEYKISHVN
jgi:hypothetical protein